MLSKLGLARSQIEIFFWKLGLFFLEVFANCLCLVSCVFFQVMSSYDQMSQGLQIFSFAKIQFANIQFAWVKHLSEFNFFKVQNR